MTTCKHPSGDFIDGVWLCAWCWEKLDEQPRTYGREPMPYTAKDSTGGPFEIRKTIVLARPEFRQTMKLAPIAYADEVRLFAFIVMVANRLMDRGGLNRELAIDHAIELLRLQDTRFGDPDFAWDQGGAEELADEDLGWWDYEDPDTN